jgi:hypothetical protein
LSFYVHGAGCVLASPIARWPCSGSDRGQRLIFHEFMQSWVGYKLMKVLVTFGLQPNALNDSLMWSPDLHDILSCMVTKQNKVKYQVKENAQQIVEVIFNEMLHTGHFNRVHFGAMNKFLRRMNQTLSLVILTWLHQLQQFFCD